MPTRTNNEDELTVVTRRSPTLSGCPLVLLKMMLTKMAYRRSPTLSGCPLVHTNT